MRIALITDGIWPYVIGGMQKHSYYLCKYLAQQKIQVELFHFNASNYDISKLEFFSEEEKKYIQSYIVPIPKVGRFPGHYLYASYKHSQLIFDLIKENLANYQFIYTKGFTGWYLIHQKFSKKIACAPIGVKFHGYEMFQKPPDLKTKLQHILLLRWAVRGISKQADIVFSYGGKITEIIRSIGVDEHKIFELASGVESAAVENSIQTSGEVIKVLFLGRYERRKGIEELNQAIVQCLLRSEQNDIEFHFIGPIPETKRLKNDKVFYHGEMRDKINLTKAIRSCDVLICPSWSEGMPNVILEAMANGLAVIATDVGATNVLVSDKTGWLLRSSQVDEITQALLNLRSEPRTSIDAKKQQALDLIKEKFIWEKLILHLKTLF